MANTSARSDKLRRFELKTLLETSRLLIESRDTDFVLNNLLLITMGKLLIPRGAVLLQESGGDDTYTVRKIKGNVNVEEGARVVIPWKADKLENIAVYPNKMDLQMPKLFKNQKRGIFFHLKTSNQHIGYLYLDPKIDGGELDEHEIEFVESLSIISSVAIANSRMFKEMRRMNRKLDRRIYQLNTLFNLSKDFSLMVDREKIASTFKFALLGQLLIRKFFFLYAMDGGLELMASSGLNRFPDHDERKQMFELAEDVLLIDSDHFEAIPYLRENEIAALAALQMQGEKTAIVGVSAKASGENLFQSDFNFLQSLGNLAILSIQKTIFLEERIEKEKLEEEINIARTIQQGLFPKTIPAIPSLDLAAKSVPSEQVGGDYFDIVKSPDENHIFAIGDVTGKGIPAALLMANLQSMLHVLLPVDVSLSEATSRINHLIFENTPSDKFITFFWAKYFHKNKVLKFINAGHNPPLLLRNESEEFYELTAGGLILGAMSSLKPYEETDLQLYSGDILVLYTDGITETFDPKGNDYDTERLKTTILNSRKEHAREILEAVIADVSAFSGNRLSDDLTLIVIKVI